jgi:DNA-binding GntR family transcriptional regulator
MSSHSYANPLAERVYGRLKEDIFEFRLLPGDHFTETRMASYYEVSRTPMRDALYRLQREGFLEVGFRRGWRVRNLDFAYFDDLYDLRIILEITAIERICQMTTHSQQLLDLKEVWIIPKKEQEKDGRIIARLDENFHTTLVSIAANKQIARVHAELTEKIRIIRRLDFTDRDRIKATYQEHGKILKLLLQRKFVEVSKQLRSHIEQSKLEVRKITLHRLHEAQSMNCPVHDMVTKGN